jgi:2-dehydro-3-deoxyphosphogluconate aldolase / (4S)-4-hydroxy-2-oxoglutarate aldolase
MDDMLKKINELGIVPVVKIENADDAVPLGKALLEGDLPVAEITFRTDAAEQAIKNLTKELPEVLVGAGTVLTIDQAKRATGAGAKFIVSPGFNPKVVDYCVSNNIPVTPGVNSPTQIEMALEHGLKVVKYFPAETSGGLKMLKSMSAPYGDMKFIPTGGINADNLLSYLSFNKVLACGGSWMVKADLISAGKFDEITEKTKEAMKTMLGFEFKHLGINEKDEKNAISSAEKVENVFGFKAKAGNSSVFNDKVIEIMKTKYLGDHGHIAIGTNDIHRAIAYLERKGIKTKPDTAKEKEGSLIAVYLDMDISGFAVHLLQK